MTIFRLVEWLERFGHHQTLWLQNAGAFRRRADGQASDPEMVPAYRITRPRSFPAGRRAADFGRCAHCDGLLDRLPGRASPERQGTLLPDPGFRALFPRHRRPRLIAEATYDFGFANLCAGTWLLDRMQERSGWARSWDLCADHDVYFPGRRCPRSQTGRSASPSMHAATRRAGPSPSASRLSPCCMSEDFPSRPRSSARRTCIRRSFPSCPARYPDAERTRRTLPVLRPWHCLLYNELLADPAGDDGLRSTGYRDRHREHPGDLQERRGHFRGADALRHRRCDRDPRRGSGSARPCNVRAALPSRRRPPGNAAPAHWRRPLERLGETRLHSCFPSDALPRPRS